MGGIYVFFNCTFLVGSKECNLQWSSFHLFAAYGADGEPNMVLSWFVNALSNAFVRVCSSLSTVCIAAAGGRRTPFSHGSGGVHLDAARHALAGLFA